MQRIAIILACFFFCVNCFSQFAGSGGQYPFVHYTPKDGLVNSRVGRAYQDSKGLMYFLTGGGLSVYDGARFRNYTMQNGLPFDIINDLLEVADDSLLIAPNTGALVALVKGRIVTIKTEGVHCPTINRFYRVDRNRIYLACDEGLFLLEGKKITQLNILPQLNGPEAPYLGNISGFGNFLVLTTHELRGRKGLYVYDIKNNRICDALGELEVYLLDKDKNNKIWLSISDKLFVLDSAALVKGKILTGIPGSGYSEAKDLSTTNVCFDKNSVWMVVRENTKNKEIRRIAENGDLRKMPLPEQAAASNIKNIFLDREDNIWLCNDGEGVFKIVNSPLQIFDNPLNQLTEVNINQVFYSGKNVWLHTTINKLFRRSRQSLQEFDCNLKESPFVLYEGKDKIIARDQNTIYEGSLNRRRSIFFQKKFSLTAPDLFSGTVKITPDDFIIASQSTGLNVWKNKNLVLLLPVAKNDFIQELTFDNNNFLWVTTRHNGIDVFSLHPEDPQRYLQMIFHFSAEQLIGSPRSFVIDKAGVIWTGTRDHGLIGYKQEGGLLKKIYHCNVSTGLTDNFVTSLACDSFNNIIVGTQTGLDRIVFNKEGSYRIENLSRSSNYFSFIIQLWADKENAYALTFSGVLLQVSSLTTENKIASPQLLLQEMKVNAQPIATARDHFDHHENNLSFLVAAPSFVDEKRVAYSYLLEGSGNENWSDTTATNANINLTNLSAGKYLLKVKAFFPSALYAPAELSYSFEITPPWWQTWWFRSIAGLFIIGLLIIGSKFYYKRKLERQMATLEKQQAVEKERTRIATDMHDDLGAGLSRIKFLSETIGIKKQQQQPIEEDISKIRQYSHEMIDKMGEIVWALNEKNDSLTDLLSYSRSYAVEYLSQAGIECEVKAPENFPLIFLSGEFRRNIYLVLKEALHNIVKHAQASRVKIRIDIDQNLMIVIKDDGVGFDKNNLRPFSNGLSNMKKRMKDIGGNLEIKNEDGVAIVLSAPIG
jgi:signal transduction histidine kinase/ligand-binding sensor domain-containing protein